MTDGKYFFYLDLLDVSIRRCGVVGRIPAFELGARVRFPSVQEFYFISWDGVCILCVLSCVVSGGCPDIF